ncbi:MULTISPECIES: hypothetical protein [unclassified Nonomuraea]|uniref:hypothetical protein n=1 Tax=unclassified Nonomuraea TaxID=2593643 RepID=UPI0010FD0559|nr:MULTISPECIES: hypothetical protein [unclassified Nonomuraea]NBE91692.1 hypothetical protein [Nonomuraea sp. K271]
MKLPRSTAVALAAIAMAAPLLSTASPAAAQSASAWNCTSLSGSGPSSKDKDGRDVWAECHKGNEWVRAYFRAYDEKVELEDHHGSDPNSVVAYLTVAGSGTARFKGAGTRDKSYDEGKAVSIKVCTSDSSTKVCHTQSGGKT